MNLNREFTAPECDRFRRDCNFTDDELAVFNLRVRGKSRIEISIDLHMSTATVDRRLRQIKMKIHRVL